MSPPLVSRFLSGDQPWLEQRIRLAWRSGRLRDNSGEPVFAPEQLGRDYEHLGVKLYGPTQKGSSDFYVEVIGSGDPRQQAAVADELRRLIVQEIVADVAVAGILGGLFGAMLSGTAAETVRLVRSRRRIRRGLCPGCGYDVRHSPNRCPECGRELASAMPAPANP